MRWDSSAAARRCVTRPARTNGNEKERVERKRTKRDGRSAGGRTNRTERDRRQRPGEEGEDGSWGAEVGRDEESAEKRRFSLETRRERFRHEFRARMPIRGLRRIRFFRSSSHVDSALLFPTIPLLSHPSIHRSLFIDSNRASDTSPLLILV